MVRVRVWFIEPGDKFNLSEIDEGMSPVKIEDSDVICAEELLQLGYLRIAKEELADSIGFNAIAAISSPNDPVVESARSLVVVFFDPMEINADWSGSGGVGEEIENFGGCGVFKDHLEGFVDYARRIAQMSLTKREDYGVRVMFLTLWRLWSTRDYWGEFDGGCEFVGYFTHSDINVQPQNSHYTVTNPNCDP
jgi:hypothetical protein